MSLFYRPALSAGLFLWSILFITPGVTTVHAQDNGSVIQTRVALSTEGGMVPAGETIQAAIIATLAPGFHVNAHKPTQKWLIPTELIIEGMKDVAIDSTLYPQPMEKALEFSDGAKLALYEETFTIGLIIRTKKTLAPGKYTLKGVLGYQACNDQMCMAPDEIPVAITFSAGKAGQPVRKTNQTIFYNDPSTRKKQ